MQGEHALPVGTDLSLGRVWRKSLQDEDREKAFAAAEVGTLLNLRRALRNGSVWIDHSLSFRSRETLFIPRRPVAERPAAAHYRRLHLPQDPAAFLEPLIERAQAGMQAVSKTAAEGILRVDDELHLTPLEPMAEDPKLIKLRAALDRRVGEAQLPELILAVDAEVRFSWIMLGREPRSSKELLMVYAGILAHGTALSAAETARMIPQLSAASVRQAMKWAERRAPPRTGLQRRARFHASPSDFGDLGTIRFGLLRHDEHGDQPAGVCRPQRPASIDALRRHLFPYARSLGHLLRAAHGAQRPPSRRRHRRGGAR